MKKSTAIYSLPLFRSLQIKNYSRTAEAATVFPSAASPLTPAHTKAPFFSYSFVYFSFSLAKEKKNSTPPSLQRRNMATTATADAADAHKTNSPKLVGDLACQHDSFQQTLDTFVVRCGRAAAATTTTAKQSKKKENNNKEESNEEDAVLYEIVCHDSVLFPEGGGQPCDRGTLTYTDSATGEISTVSIANVQRQKDTCVLYSPKPIPAGTTVTQTVDWPRRLDHMQHHTAQHVLTRVVEDAAVLNLKTISWSLTHPFCFIVVDLTPIMEAAAAEGADNGYAKYVPFVNLKEKKVKQEMLQQIEDACNAHVAAGRAVRCDVTHTHRDAYESENNNDNGNDAKDTVRSRGIPADVSGPIRKITVEGVDACTCCGTHLTQLSQLHAILVLPYAYQEVKGNTVKLFFLTGERLLRYAGDMLAREKALVSLLGGTRPELFVAEVQKQNKEKAANEKVMKKWMGELAVYAAEGVKKRCKTLRAQNAGDPGREIIVVLPLKEDVDLDYYNTIRNELDGKKNTKEKRTAGENEIENENEEKEDYSSVVLLCAWAPSGATAAQRASEGQVMINGNGNQKEQLEKVVAQVKTLLCGRPKSHHHQQHQQQEKEKENDENDENGMEGAVKENVIKGGISKTGFRGKGNISNWKSVEQFDWSHFFSSSSS